MKICMIIYAYSPHAFGGADIYTEKISKELVKRGNPTVIITVNPGRKYLVEDDGATTIYRFHPFNIATVHSIGRRSFVHQAIWTALDIYNHYSYIKIKKILEKEKPDVVHIHTPLDVTLSAFEAVKNLRLPLVFTLHDYLLLCRRVVLIHGSGEICSDKNINPLCKMYRKFCKIIVEDKIDIVIAPSQFVLDMYKSEGFFKHSKTIVLPHGVDLNNTPDFIEKEWRSHKKSIDILYVGSLTKHKGVHILIKAFRQVENENIKLHIVGNGIYENTLRHLAKGDSRIIFHGKFSNRSVQKFYSIADVLVIPSIWYDVHPNVITEAFKAGVPVIGSNIGGIPELVLDNYNGFLFNPGEAEQLKKIFNNILENPIRLSELSKNSQEYVKRFDMTQYILRLGQLYKEAIEINRIKQSKRLLL